MFGGTHFQSPAVESPLQSCAETTIGDMREEPATLRFAAAAGSDAGAACRPGAVGLLADEAGAGTGLAGGAGVVAGAPGAGAAGLSDGASTVSFERNNGVAMNAATSAPATSTPTTSGLGSPLGSTGRGGAAEGRSLRASSTRFRRGGAPAALGTVFF